MRIRIDYSPEEYYRQYLLEHLRNYELSANTELVKLLKNGERRVCIKDLKAKYGEGKHASVNITRKYPEILERYRKDKTLKVEGTLDHFELAQITGARLPDWDNLVSELLKTPLGTESAMDYQKRVEKLLSALFSPDLAYPELEQKIHEGRKRIDITYTNVSSKGFFKWVGDYSPASYIFVECKNYSRDIANPELDQIAGRFSKRSGKFGIIICRKIDDKALFIKRCRDIADDDRGYIIPLDDSDLENLVTQVRDPSRMDGEYPLLKQLYDRLVL